MGLYDRDYYRDERQPGIRISSDLSAVATLIIANVAIAVVGFFFRIYPNGQNWLTEHLGLGLNLIETPWKAWQLLTYGFLHSPTSITHLLFNMIGLWVFGSDIERLHGRREFYKLYFSLLILSGLFYAVIQTATGQPGNTIGASGGVMGVAVIFACHFPRRLIYIWGVLPVPAYLLVILYVAADLLGTQRPESTTAHWVHLGGAAFGFFVLPHRLEFVPAVAAKLVAALDPYARRGPKLRVHRSETEDEVESPPDDYLTTGRLQQRVDQLLEKISRSGEGSLTDEERRFLADASRRYQQHRRR